MKLLFILFDCVIILFYLRSSLLTSTLLQVCHASTSFLQTLLVQQFRWLFYQLKFWALNLLLDFTDFLLSLVSLMFCLSFFVDLEVSLVDFFVSFTTAIFSLMALDFLSLLFILEWGFLLKMSSTVLVIFSFFSIFALFSASLLAAMDSVFLTSLGAFEA